MGINLKKKNVFFNFQTIDQITAVSTVTMYHLSNWCIL